MKISIIRLFVAMFVMFGLTVPTQVSAGTLEDLETAVQYESMTGGIYDSDLHDMLMGLVQDAQVASDAEAENALRSSIQDICSAFTGVGMTASAATSVSTAAQP